MSERISALSKVSTRIPRNKVWAIPIIRLVLTQVSRHLFTASDARAQQRGWQITAVQGGLGRRYRDPRFDGLIRCPSCAGMGSIDGRGGTPCGPCGGTGRVTKGAILDPVRGGVGHA
jgi:hypothetical protein